MSLHRLDPSPARLHMCRLDPSPARLDPSPARLYFFRSKHRVKIQDLKSLMVKSERSIYSYHTCFR